MLNILWLILASLCILYSIIIRASGSGSAFFIVWIALSLVFVLFSYFAKIHLWTGLPKLLKAAVLTLVLIGAGLFLYVESLVVSGFGMNGPNGLDCIIVLGAQVYEYGPSVVLTYRLDKAIEYLDKNPETIAIVSGGKGSDEHDSEAAVMAEYLTRHGISSDRIFEENASTTTAENLRFSRPLIPEDASIGIISNNFHMYRALQIAKEQGLDGAVGIAAPSTPFYLPNNMFREFFALIKFWMFRT